MKTSAQVLELQAVPERSNLFVLGCFASNVTLRSQQVRALNLAMALKDQGRITKGMRVVIVGAGAAGLTAAVAFARLGCRVQVVEKLDRPMALQYSSPHRFIHPFIDAWPYCEVEDTHSGLGILDWEADYARGVANQIVEQWEREVSLASGSIQQAFDAHGLQVNMAENLVTWNSPGPHGAPYDIAILAVGFGLEEERGLGIPRYWENDNLDDHLDGRQRTCLVSGAGDSGLTDLMRLCIRRFRHDIVLRMCATPTITAEVREIFDKASNIWRSSTSEPALSQFFEELEHPAVMAALRPMLRGDRSVWLTSNRFSDVFGPRSAFINRFIVSQLSRIGAFQWIGGPVRSIGKWHGRAGKREVMFADGQRRLFDVVVVRYGPRSALEQVPQIWALCDRLKERWKGVDSLLDPTRQPQDYASLTKDYVLPAPSGKLPPREAKLVVFDLDGTLIQGEEFVWSWKRVWDHLGIPEAFHKQTFHEHIRLKERGDPEWYSKWCRETGRYFRQYGLTRAHFQEMLTGLRVADGLEKTVRGLRKRGIRCAIVSGGMDCMLEALIPNHGELFHEVFINRVRFKSDGTFEGIDPTPFDFEGKAKAIEQMCRDMGIKKAQVLFVGDGFNDQPLLYDHEIRFVALNPATSQVKHHADHRIKRVSGVLRLIDDKRRR